MKQIFALIFLCSQQIVLGQNEVILPASYTSNIDAGDSLLEKGNFQKAVKAYAAAFRSFGGRGVDVDIYKAARAYGLNGQSDSAIIQLKKLQGLYFFNYQKVQTDPAFKEINRDKTWDAIIDSFKINKIRMAPKVDLGLMNMLDSILQSDQGIRMLLGKALAGDKASLPLVEQKMKITDSINLIKVAKFLDEFGWLGEDTIGMAGVETLFLVIQHSNTDTQEKYIPLLRDAVKIGKAPPHQLAMMEDRLSVAKTGFQIYGSQLFMNSAGDGKYQLRPILDERNVNKRRKEVGLQPLEIYLQQWNIVYKIPK